MQSSRARLIGRVTGISDPDVLRQVDQLVELELRSNSGPVSLKSFLNTVKQACAAREFLASAEGQQEMTDLAVSLRFLGYNKENDRG